MLHIQVFHEKQHEHYLVPIDRSDNFRLLKEKLYIKLEGLVDDEEKTYSVFTLEMASQFAKQVKRLNHTPFESDNVFDAIQRIESSYSGYIILKLVDIRGLDTNGCVEFLPAAELLNQSVHGALDRLERVGELECCTSWATANYNSIGGGILGLEHINSGSVVQGGAVTADALHVVPRLFCSPTLLDSLFMELSSMAAIQGRLFKKTTNYRKQDIWREQYFVLDGRMGRLWFFPIAADLSASGSNNSNASNINHTRELCTSGLGVPTYISLLSGTNTRAQDAISVTAHRSDPTVFTITISETYNVGSSSMPVPLSPFNSRAVTLRAPTADKAAKWVNRLSSLHGMLYQPLLPPSPDNPRLYDQVALKFINEYAEGKNTYTAAVQHTLAAHQQQGHHDHTLARLTAAPSLAACGGGGGEDAPPVPTTARCASHWAGNSMIESLEECTAAIQMNNTVRDADSLENLLTFEGMLKSKYLRGYFQKYLMNNCTEETLLFWEYAEDYWRAHPFTPHPFAPSFSYNGVGSSARMQSNNEVLSVLKQQDVAMLSSPEAVRQWAESLYLTFIHYNAPYQIGCCSGRDMLRVGAALDQLGPGEMPPYNLFRSIQQSTFNFMKTMCYPDFIALPSYHRILVAALHAGDRAAMHVNVMSTCVTSEREASTFDGFNHSASVSSFPSAATSSNISSPVVSRGFLGLMKNIVGSRIREQPSTATSSSKNESSVVDVHSYPARWRVVKLVAFELVRGDPGLMMTTTGTAAASVDSVPTGSTKYKIGRRRDSSRSIVGDKLRKIRAMQNGVYKKIAWLPEWWWDLVPALNAHESGSLSAGAGAGAGDVWDGSALSEVGEGFLDDDELPQWTGTEEESFLDETGDSEQLSDPPSSAAPLNSWTYSADCGTDWMPKDLNYIKGVFEKVRQTTATVCDSQSAGATLDLDLLLMKQLKEEEHQSDPHIINSTSTPALFLPPGWKPNAVNNPINSAKVAQLLEPPRILPSMMKYTSAMPTCIKQLNLTKGRALLEDYAHLQPVGYHMQVAQAGTGTLLFCAVVRCRYVRLAQKQQPAGVLMRGFRGSTNVGAPPSATDRRSFDSIDASSSSHSPPRTHSVAYGRRPIAGGTSGGGLLRSESVTISSAPLPILSPPRDANFTRSALQQQMVRRSDEFTNANNSTTISEWPRQCAALYVCLGVPRLYLIDPTTLIPSASIDVHAVRKIAPTETCLHSIDLQDPAGNVWQISPEGLDADDTRDGAGRWINMLGTLSLPTTPVVYIIKSGFLHKRGRLNRAFKLRWFVLCSDLKLHYYKDDQHGVHKGTIALTSDANASQSGSGGAGAPPRSSGSAGQKQVVRFDKELVVTTLATQRMYTLLAEDALQAEDWVTALNDLLASSLQPSVHTHNNAPPSTVSDGEMEEEEEEEEEEEDEE